MTRTLLVRCAGVVAGLVSRLVTFPADTLKARLQVVGALRNNCSNGSSAVPLASAKVPGGNPGAPPAAAVAQLLWQREGLSGFFRGFGAVALGTVPGQAAYFGGYECGKLIIDQDHGMLGDMAVGCIAQLIAGVAFTPIDIIKERLQVRGHWPLLCSTKPCICRLGHLHVMHENAEGRTLQGHVRQHVLTCTLQYPCYEHDAACVARVQRE